jgi:hypothetical protein
MRYYLVIDRTGPEAVYVFLARDPGEDGWHLDATSVILSPLPPAPGRRPPSGLRPVLGRSVADPGWYREFRSAAELPVDGYEPVGPYRVYDRWDEYQSP